MGAQREESGEREERGGEGADEDGGRRGAQREESAGREEGGGRKRREEGEGGGGRGRRGDAVLQRVC